MAPVDMLRRLRNYYSGAAADVKILFTLLYVVPFYLSPATRPSPTLNRDAPSVIRARIRAVTVACVISSLSTSYLIVHLTKATIREPLHLLGWYPVDPLNSVIKPFSLVVALFAGPLFERLCVEGVDTASIIPTLKSSIGYRNLVAGPITEEAIFRSAIIPLHLLAHISPSKICFLSPLYFGIAHVHHFYEFTLTHPHTPWLPILLRSLFQFTYTTLFGWFATFVYLRSGSIYTVIAIHTFCNWIGFPRFWGRVQGKEAFAPVGPYGPIAKMKDGPNVSVGDGVSAKAQDRGELPLLWTVVYYLVLIAGVYGFYIGLWPLTESSNALAAFKKA